MDIATLLRIQLETSTLVAGGEPTPTRNTMAQYALAWIAEVVELVQELNWKPWKKDKQVDRARVLDELADTWAFMLLYTNLVMKEVDATPEEVVEAYLEKTRVNRARGRGEVAGYGRKELLENGEA